LVVLVLIVQSNVTTSFSFVFSTHFYMFCILWTHIYSVLSLNTYGRHWRLLFRQCHPPSNAIVAFMQSGTIQKCHGLLT